MLDEQSFLQVVSNTPLVSIDLVIQNKQGEVLLGRRKNRPAHSYWFVPGGRIRKNERLSTAFERLCAEELQFALSFSEASLLGVYEHLYEDNFAGEAGIDTHYVVLAYAITVEQIPPVELLQQHDAQDWWNVKDLLKAGDVHANTKAYFLA